MPLVATLSGAPLQKRFGLPLHVAHYRRGSFQTHYHSFLELILVNADQGYNVIAGTRTAFRRRQVYQLGTFHPHRIEAEPGSVCDYYNVTFLPESLPVDARTPGSHGRLLERFYSTVPGPPIELDEDDYERAVSFCRSIEREAERRDAWSPSIAAHSFQALLLIVARQCGAGHCGAADRAASVSTDARVQSALRIIAERFDEPLESRELARAVGVSPARLAQLFRAHTGSTVRKALIRRRLTEAKRLLATSSSPITAILHESGFNDVSYFNRLFRADTGVTPREFRRAADSDR